MTKEEKEQKETKIKEEKAEKTAEETPEAAEEPDLARPSWLASFVGQEQPAGMKARSSLAHAGRGRHRGPPGRGHAGRAPGRRAGGDRVGLGERFEQVEGLDVEVVRWLVKHEHV